MQTYKIFAAHRDDMHQGWVWMTRDADRPRSVVKITNPGRGIIYCEALQIDANFISAYNQPDSNRGKIEHSASCLVLSEWFRKRLGLQETLGAEAELAIANADSWIGRFRAGTQHPQNAVRLVTLLSGIGFVLGVVGFAAALWPCFQWLLSLPPNCVLGPAPRWCVVASFC